MSEALRALRDRYRASVPNTVAGFTCLAAQWTVAPDKCEVLESLRREVHRVHRTPKSFDYVTPVNIRILLAKIPSSLARAAAP